MAAGLVVHGCRNQLVLVALAAWRMLLMQGYASLLTGVNNNIGQATSATRTN